MGPELARCVHYAPPRLVWGSPGAPSRDQRAWEAFSQINSNFFARREEATGDLFLDCNIPTKYFTILSFLQPRTSESSLNLGLQVDELCGQLQPPQGQNSMNSDVPLTGLSTVRLLCSVSQAKVKENLRVARYYSCSCARKAPSPKGSRKYTYLPPL